jgi:hypothetical protein
MNEAWMVSFYNEADAGFGYDPGPQVLEANLTKAFAKSYARHLNKTTPAFVFYYAEPEPERWT